MAYGPQLAYRWRQPLVCAISYTPLHVVVAGVTQQPHGALHLGRMPSVSVCGAAWLMACGIVNGAANGSLAISVSRHRRRE